MGFITKTQVKKAISLGTLNPKIIDDFFNDIKFKSYDYDYLIQDQLIDTYIQQANFKSDVFIHTDVIMNGVRDGYKDKVSIFQLDKSLVYYGRRKSFKHFSMYNKPLPQSVIMTRRDIFKYGILTFINGILDMNFRIQARDDKTFLLFPYSRYDKTVQPTDTITSVMIPESVIAVSRVMTSSGDKTGMRIKDWVFSEDYIKYFKECNGFMAFFIRPGYNPLFYTDITYNAEGRYLEFQSLPSSIDGYYMVLVGMENFDSTITVRGTDEYFSIPRHNMPVPKNNLLVMIQDPNGYSYHINSGEVEITEYYHNIYKVSNPAQRSFKVIVQYSNKSANELLEYDTEIDYFLSLINVLDRYRDGTVPDVLKEYKPLVWDYNVQDYLDSMGLPGPISDPWYPFLYKLKKISSIYKIWCLFFQTYIRRTYGFLENWVMDVSTIDLESRYRESTLPEIPMKSSDYRPFATPKYIFKYKNFSNYDTTTPYAWFIDGRFAVPDYVVSANGYQYVWFDATLIKPDSLIEIERYDGNQFQKKFVVGDGPTEINLKWLERPTLANTLFLTDGEGYYINEGYVLEVQDANLGETWFPLDLVNSVFILENGMKLRLTPTEDRYKNKEVTIACNNKSAVWNVFTTGGSFGANNLNAEGQIELVKQDLVNRIRVFNHDGRMFPRYGYSQTKNSNIKQLPYFEILVDATKGDPFKVEYMGYEEKQVYYQEDIPLTGIVDFTGKLDKPFSLTYHSVFLNGFKLNEKNIVQISPFVIAVQNVATVHDFRVYERLHDSEFFGFDQDEPSSYIADTLYKEDPVFFEKILEELTDIVIDPSIEDIDDDVDMLLALIKEVLQANNVNMDTEYTPEEFDRYEELFDDWRLLLNADDRIRYHVPEVNWFYMSHDLNIIFNGE